MNWQSREDERVARALDGAPPQERPDRAAVALAGRIRAVPAATGLDAAPEFRATLRARLLAEGAALLPRPRTSADAPPDPCDRPGTAAGPPVRPGRPRHAQPSPARRPARPARRVRPGRRKAVAAAALVLATLSASTVAASGDALPGDPLYGLKRRVQDVELIVARTDADRGHRHLELARTRVRELATAGVSAPPGPLLSTLDDMDAETRDGVRLLSGAAVDRADEARLTGLAAWIAEQRALLLAASARLPAGARSRAADSLALLATSAARIEELRCDCPAPPLADDLSPRACGSRCGARTQEPRARTETRPTQPQTRAAPGPATTPAPTGPVPASPTDPRSSAAPPRGTGPRPVGSRPPMAPAPTLTVPPPAPDLRAPAFSPTPVPQLPVQPDPARPGPNFPPGRSTSVPVTTGLVGATGATGAAGVIGATGLFRGPIGSLHLTG